MPARLLPAALLALALGAAGPAAAQAISGGSIHSPILTIDTERLFLDSAYGRRTTEDLEARSAELAAENRRIEAELSAEERTLTERRPTMAAEDFRSLADAFDEKVQATRRAQEGKNRALTQEFDNSRVAFLKAAVPALEDLMRTAGAAVILERRSVFISVNAIDVTAEAIARVNEVLGDGSDLLETQAPATSGSGTPPQPAPAPSE
ncbi:OmpH family outer membrane protein [Sulfitobacter sp. LCG007]